MNTVGVRQQVEAYREKAAKMTPEQINTMLADAAAFAAMMMIFRQNMMVNILVTVVYVWTIVLVLYRAQKKYKASENIC